MEFPGFKKKSLSPHIATETLKGRTIDTVYKSKTAEGCDTLEIYCQDGSHMTIVAEGDRLSIAGEVLQDKKALNSGYGGSFYHLDDLEMN